MGGIDAYIAATGMAAPQDTLPVLRDGFAMPQLRELDLSTAGITAVIWATSYRFDFSIVRLPVLDADGFPMQNRGVTAYPGLYFVGIAAANSFGPLLRFVFGTKFTARRLTRHLASLESRKSISLEHGEVDAFAGVQEG